MKTLVLEQNADGQGGATVSLIGQIDEASDYSGVDLSGLKRVAFDFEKIKLINSTGLQRWIKFLEGIDKGIEIAFVRCAIRVITQINMFPGFMAGRAVKVESFFAPYFCEACDKSQDLLLERAKHFPDSTQIVAPKMQCQKCGGPAEFDGIVKKYFIFLKP
jgi:hypothetical protein